MLLADTQRDDAQNNLSPQHKRHDAVVGRTPRVYRPAILLLYILLLNVL